MTRLEKNLARPDAALIEALERANLHPLWDRYQRITPAAPQAKDAPMHWRWSDLEPIALRALELVRPGRGEGERRAITLHNPSIPASGGATHSLTAAVQVVRFDPPLSINAFSEPPAGGVLRRSCRFL